MVISPEVQSAIDEILKAVLVAVVPLLVALVRAFVMAKIAEIKSTMTDQQLAQLEYWGGLIVKAIEQSELKEGVERTAEEKLNLAISMLQDRANSIGLSGLSVNDYANIVRAKLRDGVHKSEEDLQAAYAVSGQSVGFDTDDGWDEEISTDITAVYQRNNPFGFNKMWK